MPKRQHNVIKMVLRDDGFLMLCEEGVGVESVSTAVEMIAGNRLDR